MGVEARLLPESFYRRNDVVAIARELLGKVVYTASTAGEITAGRIVEAEAYAGANDQACHAHAYRKTYRTAVMFEPGGKAYIYWCYGTHALLNLVTGPENVPECVLIRALEPLEGEAHMLRRRKLEANKGKLPKALTSGPGKLTQALGLTAAENTEPLTGSRLWVADDGTTYPDRQVAIGPRVGMGKSAGPDAYLPYRFWVLKNRWVSPMPSGYPQDLVKTP